jgi:hypothetical protein
MPRWLAELVRPAAPAIRRHVARSPFDGDSIADWYTAAHSWHDVLDGWTVVAGNGDEDGSRWRHPSATHDWSATIRHGLLFCYSPNTPFEQTDAGQPHGYTRFRAWAVLHQGGDLSAAARAARQLRNEAA